MRVNVLPQTYFALFLVLSLGLHLVFPITKVISPPYTYLGAVLIIFGIVMNIWADALFKRRKTTVKPYETPTSLETSGPFRLSRHPMYLGMAAMLLGEAVVLGTLITFLFPIVFVALMEKTFIRIEEKNLERVFGKEYLSYKSRVRRWI